MESQTEQASPYQQLNEKQRLFVDYFCEYRNASRAAREAGYTDVRSNQAGYQLLTNSDISAAISQKMEDSAMTAGECLSRMSAWGRGSLEYFLDKNGELDLTSEDAIANYGTLKKVRTKKTTRTTPGGEKIEEVTTEVELHDAKDAVDKLLHLHGKYTTKIDLSNLSDEQVDQLIDKLMNKV